MHRLPLADALPYRFLPPRLSPTWVRLTRSYRRRMLRGEHLVTAVEIQAAGPVASLLERGDAVLLTPNHPGRADGFVAMEMAEALGRPTCAMAAYQLFAGDAGLRRWLFPRLGLFPVDREGADLAAFKAAVEVLTGPCRLLTIFPEGEVYHLADRLTPLREGAALIALTAARRLAESAPGRTLWIVPVGLKYRFEPDFDPTPAFTTRLDALEARLTWRPRSDQPPVERIRRLAEALLGLKEQEYLGRPQAGPLPQRIAALRDAVLGPLEDRLLNRRNLADPVPVRVKTLRRACLDRLADPSTPPAERTRLQVDLDDVFFAVQAYSYPGDYVFESPTLERIAETLAKLEEDLLLGGDCAPAPGPRRALVRFGEPIDVAAALARAGKPRLAAPMLTAELEARLQATLDALGPGRPLCVGAGDSLPPSPPRPSQVA